MASEEVVIGCDVLVADGVLLGLQMMVTQVSAPDLLPLCCLSHRIGSLLKLISMPGWLSLIICMLPSLHARIKLLWLQM